MNRAMEFLLEAKNAWYWGYRARFYVNLAIAEVQELEAENAALRRQLAALEARPTAQPSSPTGVLVVNAATRPARLTEQRRPAITDARL